MGGLALLTGLVFLLIPPPPRVPTTDAPAPKQSAIKTVKNQLRGPLERVLSPQQIPPLTATFSGRDVREVVQEIAQHAGKQISLPPELTGKISINLRNTPWLAALKAIVETTGPFTVVEIGDDQLLVKALR